MKSIVIVLGIIFVVLAQPALADSLDFSIAISATDADYRGNIDYTCDSGNRAKYNQYINAAKQENLLIESVGSFDNANSFTIETNYTGARMPLTLIGDTNFVENVGTGITNNNTAGCSKCVSGITADADDVTISSIVGTSTTSLSHIYALEIREGRIGVGYRKVNDNVTAGSTNRVRARTAVVVGYHGCVFPPAAPAAERNNIKETLCPWRGSGVGYPIFNGHYERNGNGNESRNGNRT